MLCEQKESAFRMESDIRAAGGSCSVLAETGLGEESSPPAGAEASFQSNLREKLREQQSFQGVVDLRLAENSCNLDGSTNPEDVVLASTRALRFLQSVLRENVQPATGVWLLTSGAMGTGAAFPAGAAVCALARTASIEFPELSVRCVDIANSEPSGELFSALGESAAPTVLVRDGCFLQPELIRERETIAEQGNTELIASPSGLIDLLQEVPTARREPQSDEVEIRVEANGINFRDVLNALAMLPGAGTALGGECAGTVVHAGARSGFNPGDRVFAFAPRSLQAFVTLPAKHVARIPEGLTTEQAAALPIVYLTALYGLDRLALLRQGEKILIHAAAGGLGMAAVHLAKARGAEVYATAGSDEKREYLAKLGVSHVFSSRTGEFADGVLQATRGQGVDVILNSLTGELAEKNLKVLAPGGRLLEVGKRETLSAREVQQRRPDVKYFIYDLGEESDRDASLIPTLLAELLRLIKEGSIDPLPVTVFSDVREAFRYMAQARHIGKIVVTRSLKGHEKVSISSQATYLLTGGWGGLGLKFAESLVERGARSLILMGRSAPSAAAMARIEQMRAGGAQVTIFQGDVADGTAIETALAAIPKDRPLKGVLHLAGVLDDRSLLLHDRDSLQTVMRPKWHGAWNLHLATEHLPLEFFTLFSSAVVLLGSPGQANYAAANATLDTLATWRRSRGLPGLSVQWGPWAGAGMAEQLTADTASWGLGRLAPSEAMSLLDRLLQYREPVVAVLPVTSWNRLQQKLSTGDRSPASHVKSSRIPAEQSARGIVSQLSELEPAERVAFLNEHLQQQVIRILSLPEGTRIDEDEALHDLGLDSLMAVELRNALAASLGQSWSPTLVLDYPTLRRLNEFLLAEMFGSPLENNRQPGQPEDLSESEAEELLLQELGGRAHDVDK